MTPKDTIRKYKTLKAQLSSMIKPTGDHMHKSFRNEDYYDYIKKHDR